MAQDYQQFRTVVEKYCRSVRGSGDRMGLAAKLTAERRAVLYCGMGNNQQEVPLPRNVSNALQLLKRQGFNVVYNLETKLKS